MTLRLILAAAIATLSCHGETLKLLEPPNVWSGAAQAPAKMEITGGGAVPLVAALTADGGAESFPRLRLALPQAADWRRFDTLRVRLRIASDDPEVEGKPLNFVFQDELTRVENAPGNPTVQQGIRLEATANEWTEVALPLRDIHRAAIRSLEVYVYENPPTVAHRCTVEITRLELEGGDAGETVFDGNRYGARQLGEPAAVMKTEARRVATDDGLALSLDVDGGVRTVELDGGKVAAGRSGFSGFLLRDAATAEMPARRLPGVDFEPRLESRGGYLEMGGILRAEDGRDRFVTAYVVVPAGDVRWQWGGSISTAESPAADASYELAQTKYPLSAVSAVGTGGLSLAVRMDEPVRYRLVYNPKQKLYYAAFDLAMTREKPQAAFRVMLYRHDPAWGFRSALQRYYDFFPQFFEKRVPVDGGWGVWRKHPPSEEELAEGFAYSWGPGMDVPTLRAQERAGILNLPYIEPEYWQMSLGDSASARSDRALERLRKIAAGDRAEWEVFSKLRYTATDSSGHYRRAAQDPQEFYRKLANATLQSLAAGPDGRLPAAVAKRDWIGDSGVGAMFPCNLDPRIPEGKGRFNTDVAIRAMLEDREKASGARMHGLSLDCFLGGVADFRREHFQYWQGPLTFFATARGLRPGMSTEWGSVAWLRDLRTQPWWDGRVLMANLGDNGGGERLVFAAPWLDIFGIEHAFVPDPDFMRSMARNKPVTDLPYTPREPWVTEYLQMHGIFPGDGHDPTLRKKVVPVLRSLMREGWNPVTLVRASTPDLRLERYGRYLVVHNKTASPLRGKIVPEFDSLPAREVALEGKETMVLDLKK